MQCSAVQCSAVQCSAVQCSIEGNKTFPKKTWDGWMNGWMDQLIRTVCTGRAGYMYGPKHFRQEVGGGPGPSGT